MRVALALSLTLSQAACMATAPAVPTSQGPLRVSNNGQPFQMWDGAAARKAADAACGGKVQSSIYDRFDRATGEWVYPGGCA
jgi:hypothetical protein